MVRSPLNYPGNKTKAISEIKALLPKKIDLFVDAFCGSGIVAYNSGAKKLICNDSNRYTIELLEYLYKTPGKDVISSMNKIIKEFGFTDSTNKKNVYIEHKHEGLSKYNKEPFNKLKNAYNKTRKIEYLFALVIYGFNHYLRFNKNGQYNVPVGKVDFHKNLRKFTLEFSKECKKYPTTFKIGSYLEKDLYKKCTKNSLVYFDPPYLITTAPYNNSWTENDDKSLFNLFDKLSKNNIKAAMSNVFLSNGKTNDKLIKWASKYNVHHLKRQYRNANYQKKNITDSDEVLITNY